MWYLMIEAAPLKAPKRLDDIAGAYVNAWIDASSQTKAKTHARRFLKENGFRCVVIEECRLVNSLEEFGSANTVAVHMFNRALKEGECFIVSHWPLGELDREQEQ